MLQLICLYVLGYFFFCSGKVLTVSLCRRPKSAWSRGCVHGERLLDKRYAHSVAGFILFTKVNSHSTSTFSSGFRVRVSAWTCMGFATFVFLDGMFGSTLWSFRMLLHMSKCNCGCSLSVWYMSPCYKVCRSSWFHVFFRIQILPQGFGFWSSLLFIGDNNGYMNCLWSVSLNSSNVTWVWIFSFCIGYSLQCSYFVCVQNEKWVRVSW
jgi:hypothetical protein